MSDRTKERAEKVPATQDGSPVDETEVYRWIDSAQEPPPVLYHYTSRKGLLAILKSREIHASNARYLNDTKELATAIDAAIRVLDHRASSIKDETIKDLHSHIRKFVEGRASEDRPEDVFVFSMSQKGDDLSQWRGYTRPGDGYAIGFDTIALTRIVGEKGFFFLPCQYDRRFHEDALSGILDDAEKLTQNLALSQTGEEPTYGAGLGRFALEFFALAPVIKDPAFKDEEEWRVVVSLSSVWQEGVKFREHATMLVPYLPISLGGTNLPIAEVIIGPSPHDHLEARALSGLLTANGLGGATVERSKIPYRKW